ncbi:MULTISPECIES: NUDIX hydrolase [Olivibacter]|uniref:NUDIX domain-containing protein n=1 Tax=Olivibacter jilunii TaxID=985016 RepID=A0ABW6B883_9SPHI|nr:NUDIX domain-containing protein [Olivibacter sp. UJ_SKK_5.1]MDX3915888.1 NUDIX domain-containing protein [Pseudosphingobacterium sp.]
MIDKLALIEIKDGRILSTRSRGKDTYYLPGGKREAGESDIEALIREIAEELTVTIIPESIRFYGEFSAQAHDHPVGIMVNMRCYTASFHGILQASAEIEEVVWLSYNDKPRVSEVDKIIFEDLKEKGLLR